MGLDPPAATFEFWEDGLAGSAPEAGPKAPPTLTLRLGRRDPVRGVVAARSEGDPTIYGLPPAALDLVPAGPLAYRDRSILALDRTRFAQIRRVGEGRSITLAAPDAPKGGTQSPFDQWRLIEPARAGVDGPSLARVAVLLSGLRAESLVGTASADPAAYGFDRPWLTFSWSLRPPGLSGIEGASARQGTLTVGGPVPAKVGSRYARVEGQNLVFTLGAQALQLLGAELRDHHVLSLVPDQVERLTLRWPSATVALVHDPKAATGVGGWLPDALHAAAGIELERIEPLVAALSTLQTSQYVQDAGPFPAAVGLDEPAFSAEVAQGMGLGTRRLRLGRLDPLGRRYATTEPGSSGAVFLLPGTDWAPWVDRFLPRGELPDPPFAP